MARGMYVYCVIGTSEARNFGPLGVGGRGDVVTTIAYRDLGAVVSEIAMDRYEVGREVMVAHERVLERVMVDHTILPARFYTIAPNAEEVRGLLRNRYHQLSSLLRDLEGKVELGVKALWRDMDAVLGRIIEEATEEVGARSAALGRPRLEALRARCQEELVAVLRPAAVDVRLHQTYGDDMIMNAAFLVDRSREMEFDARMEQLGRRRAEEMEFRYVGPAPPYSFVNIVIRDDAPPSPPLGRG